jgi:drug/metabolite transporter (DMT)-like permease
MYRNRWLSHLEVLTAILVWGASFIATKIALQEVSPLTVLGLRFALGSGLLGVVVAGQRQLTLPAPRELLHFALIGLIGVTIHQWSQAAGLVTTHASTTAWIVATTPVFMALLGWLTLKERLGWSQGVGIVVAAAGVLLVVSNGNPRAFSDGSFGQPGDFLVLLSALAWAVFSILSRPVLQRYSPTYLMFWVMLCGWALLLPLWLGGPGAGEIASLSARGWGAVIFLGIFCSGLAYTAWYGALRTLEAAQVGAYLYLEPLVATGVAALVLGEAVTWSVLLGGAAILAGVYLVNRS